LLSIVIRVRISLLTNYENYFNKCLIIVKQNIQINLAFHNRFMNKSIIFMKY
jgi:hypothetical protein